MRMRKVHSRVLPPTRDIDSKDSLKTKDSDPSDETKVFPPDSGDETQDFGSPPDSGDATQDFGSPPDSGDETQDFGSPPDVGEETNAPASSTLSTETSRAVVLTIDAADQTDLHLPYIWEHDKTHVVYYKAKTHVVGFISGGVSN